MVWENAHDKMLNFQKPEVKVHESYDCYQYHVCLEKYWKKIPKTSQWSFWGVVSLWVTCICTFLYFQKILEHTWIAFIIKFILIKENMWGLVCLDCKYFADYRKENLN